MGCTVSRFPKTTIFQDLTHIGGFKININRYGSNSVVYKVLESHCDGAHGVRHGRSTLPGYTWVPVRTATVTPLMHCPFTCTIRTNANGMCCMSPWFSVASVFVCARRADPDTDINRRSASGVTGSEPAVGLILFRLYYESLAMPSSSGLSMSPGIVPVVGNLVY